MMMMMLSKIGHINIHLSNQQTCGWHNPAGIQIVCDTYKERHRGRGSEEQELQSAQAFLVVFYGNYHTAGDGE